MNIKTFNFWLLFQNKRVRLTLWILIWLIAVDCCINILFPYPKNPKTIPTAFQLYFEFGRSIEGKVKRKLQFIKQNKDAPQNEAWLDTNRLKNIPVEGGLKGKLITIYGMSHANCLATAMIKLGTHRIRNITTGGAPVNWSYATFQMDHKISKFDVAILTVMTVGVADISSTSGMIAFFELPYIFTYPRYTVTDSGLKGNIPPFYTRDGFISYFDDPVKLNNYMQWLSQNDKYYSPFLFKEDISDYSVFARAFKRAYFSTFIHSKTKTVYSSKRGFNDKCDEVQTLKRVVYEFAKTARESGIMPFIYIVNNQGCGDDLYRLLNPQLSEYKIPYLSTHILCPPSDPSVYGNDGHFTLEKDQELALATFKIIDENYSVGIK